MVPYSLMLCGSLPTELKFTRWCASNMHTALVLLNWAFALWTGFRISQYPEIHQKQKLKFMSRNNYNITSHNATGMTQGGIFEEMLTKGIFKIIESYHSKFIPFK